LLWGSVFWFLIALINNKLFPFVFACGGLGLCLVSLVVALFSVRRLRLERLPIGNAVTGEAVAMPLCITNLAARRRQPFLILEDCQFTLEEKSTTLVPPLRSREKLLIKRQLPALRRGQFALDRITVRGGDPAGIFQRDRQFSLPREILIVPGHEPLPSLQLQPRHVLSGATGNPLSQSGSSQEIYAIREYTSSDGMRHIHWKSSAKLGKLMVREFERVAVTSVAILLEASADQISGSDPWSNLEYQIRAAASLGHHLAGLYCQLAFAAAGERVILLPPAPATELEPLLLVELANLKPGQTPFPALAYQLAEHLSPGTVVFCLCLEESPALLQSLELLTQQGMSVRCFCARKDTFAQDRSSRQPQDTKETGTVYLQPETSFAGVLSHVR
jgi:uncharacterized protein (DUF58 family)